MTIAHQFAYKKAASLDEAVEALMQAGPEARILAGGTDLVAWLRDHYRPDIVHITNSMFLGLVRRLKEELKVPVAVAVQGEDLFIDQLHEPYRAAVVEEMRRRAAEAGPFIAPSHYYAEHMAEMLAVPKERMRVVPLGIHLEGYDVDADRAGARPTIGYLARICPEKGLHLLVDAFVLLAKRPEYQSLQLRIAGYLGPRDRPYLEACLATIEKAGLSDRVDCLGEVDLAGKLAFLGLYFMVVSLPITSAMVFTADKFSALLRKSRRVTRTLDYLFAGIFGTFAAKILLTRSG